MSKYECLNLLNLIFFKIEFDLRGDKSEELKKNSKGLQNIREYSPR